MEPGEVVGKRFHVLRLAAAGGMGAVYQARDLMTGELVALKMMRVESGDGERRFAREANVLAELKHPGVVRYVAHGSSPDGEMYLAMEWLEGVDLHVRLTKSGVTLREAIVLLARLSEALGAAHARGVVHRDMKPGNVFLVDDSVSRAKILDFGIAHFASGTVIGTRTGAMLGTPGYVSPEQARGEKDIDARADIFSLGCILYKCVAGHAPFSGDDLLAVAAKLLFEDPPRLHEVRADVPVSIGELCARMMAKDRELRPKSAALLTSELEVHETLVGADVPGPAAVASSAALTETEQRLVSVVMASAANGDLGEQPTQFADHSAPRWKRLIGAAKPFGARVEQLADGSVVATLAGNGTATDQAARAARYALALRALLPEATLALATGRAVLSGRLPVGDVIDRAAALVRRAAPSAEGGEARSILLDDITPGLLEARFEVADDGAASVLRGELEPLETARTLLGRPTPCVGRERELGTLEVALAECFGEPASQALLVTGAPGIGKSRLLHEFLQRAKGRFPDIQIWIARGDPMSAGSPFGLLGQALRRALGVRDGEPLASRRDKLQARVARHLREADRPRVAAFLGEMLGVPMADADDVQLHAARENPLLMGDQMQRAWEDFVSAECEASPVLIVLEDLHWGDLPTVRFIGASLRVLVEAPLCVVAMGRPEVHRLFPSLWAERAPTELRLGELSRKAAEKLARGVLGGGASDATVSQIVERASGNALYLEELIRAVAQGRGDAMPETVLAMMQARLEELDAGARRVLRAASVFGQVFWPGGLRALLGGAERTNDVGDWLRVLLERELVERRAEAKFPGEHEYVFRHALVREATYAMLTDADRTLGHQLAAEWLEQQGESEAAILAEHFERGHRPERAVGWYTRAASHALEGNDFSAVLERTGRGVACGATGDPLGRLWLLAAEARRWRGENAEAQSAAEMALRFLRTASAVWYHAASELAMASSRLGNHTRLVELGERLLTLPEDDGGGPAIVALSLTAGQLLYAGRLELGKELLAKMDALVARREHSDPALLAITHRAHAIHAAVSSDPARSLGHTRLSVAAFAKAGDVRNVCLQRVNVGQSYNELGAYELAEEELREAMALAQRLGSPHVVATAKNNIGWTLARRGALAEGAAEEREAAELFARQGNRRMESASRAYLSVILARLGEADEAEREAARAIDIVEAAPDRLFALAARAHSRLAARRNDAALEDAALAMRMLEELAGIDEGEVFVRLVHAQALLAVGRRSEAIHALRGARHAVMAIADKIRDPELRDSCLRRVPENAQTLELARRLLDAS